MYNMNHLVLLEQARVILLDRYHERFAGWLSAHNSAWRAWYAESCQNLVARIELVDSHIQREISQ